MNYTEAMQYLAEASRRGIVPGLDTVRNLLAHLGNPQHKLRFVHIAGTNGKGSTTAMISSIAAAAGYTVGRYTSPAVFDDREKYAVNGEWISEAEYAGCMEIISAAVSEMEQEGLNLPTSFEIETALAMVHFVRRGCDLVVLETGMGGAMDATNVVENTLVCVLTAIGMDHMKFLGSTITEIAAQKAGIIKQGCTVVLEKQSDEAIGTVLEICRSKNAECRIACPETLIPLDSDASGQCFTCGDLSIELPLIGSFQRDNAAAAIEAAIALREKGYAIGNEAIISGLKNVNWPGRLQKIHSAPIIYIDGAHNPNAAARLAESLPQIAGSKKLVCIMGVLADKDFGEAARLVAPFAAQVITVTPNNPRALSAEALAEAVRPHCAAVEAAPDVKSALDTAIRCAGKDGVILAFGSLSYLNEVCIAAKELTI